ncbi:hypothetical protein EAE32_03820 [Kocuria tytonicola]|uniref:Uncharacterized protein n=1 Tax=Kocuria tytonicola TaxID=2055946 RepID=A0A3L9L833_9MICC|nr:hypothetical protein [Kocuria tytonicola]RLY94334.1 hypothetical protein EAE32_03820 [Kocuria tytonicola]
MNQFVKFLPAIASLLCLVIALLALLLSRVPAPGTAARKRAAQEAARTREARKVRAQRRRLLADVQAHQRNVAQGEGPVALR